MKKYLYLLRKKQKTDMNRPRYDILDGLRGVAAVMVLLYHVFNDAKSFFVWPAPVYEFYHGFLGVDFFFILSGFVMGYAYDLRLEDRSLTLGGFIKRRLIRLHPMVVMGVILGLIAFLIQGCTKWDGTEVSLQAVMWATLLGLFLIPSPLGMDVRGNTEAFPLNGPHWSLFFEYIGSLLYGILLHRLSTKWLRVWVACGPYALCLSYGLTHGQDVPPAKTRAFAGTCISVLQFSSCCIAGLASVWRQRIRNHISIGMSFLFLSWYHLDWSSWNGEWQTATCGLFPWPAVLPTLCYSFSPYLSLYNMGSTR